MVKVIVFVVIAIFWIVKNVLKNADSTPAAKPQSQKKSNTNSTKSAQQIYDEFIKEIEKSKAKQQQQPKVVAQTVQTKATPKKNVDWQKVDHSQMTSKKQLINHEDYENVSHRIDASHKIQEIAETEGELFSIETENIDWKQAIITKEILDRKYT